MIVWKEAKGVSGERARKRWPRRTVRRGGEGGLKKDRKSENEEEERGVDESTWTNSDTEGGSARKYVGCKGVVEK